MEALRGAGSEVHLREIAAVGVEDVDQAELVELAAGALAELVVEVPGGEVDVLGADQIADAGAVVALLDFVPPALALVLDHGGFFDEDTRGGAGGAEQVKQGVAGAGDGSEELPAGEDRGFACCGGDAGEELGGLFAAFECSSRGTGAGEAGVDGGEEFFGDGGFGEREQQGVVELAADERWVSGSKALRMDSTSSPKNSTRTGRSISGE